MFQSSKGIYHINRALWVSYIGSDVEGLSVGQTITSAQLIPTTNQVRFTLDSGIALVFDYLMHQWSVFKPLNAVDSTIWNGTYCYLRPDGKVMQEAPGVYTDNGSWIKLKIVTAWLAWNGLQGYQRVREMMILGGYASPAGLQVGVAYDYNPAITQTDYIASPITSVWGIDSVWGGNPAVPTDSTVWGGVYSPSQWRVFMTQQKCEAVQVSLEDHPSGTIIGEGISISGFSFEVAGKGGAFRLPSSKSYG
jgi:hypothetical protein